MAINLLQHLPTSTKVCRELLQLTGRVDAPWLELGVPHSGYFLKSGWESNKEQGIGSALNLHKKLIALWMI